MIFFKHQKDQGECVCSYLNFSIYCLEKHNYFPPRKVFQDFHVLQPSVISCTPGNNFQKIHRLLHFPEISATPFCPERLFSIVIFCRKLQDACNIPEILTLINVDFHYRVTQRKTGSALAGAHNASQDAVAGSSWSHRCSRQELLWRNRQRQNAAEIVYLFLLNLCSKKCSLRELNQIFSRRAARETRLGCRMECGS